MHLGRFGAILIVWLAGTSAALGQAAQPDAAPQTPLNFAPAKAAADAHAGLSAPPLPIRKAAIAADEKPKPIKRGPVPAKELFGAVRTAAPLAARAIGTYARGCLAGAKPLAIDGPSWQAMRLSRNRNWGHPELIKLIERLAGDAKAVGWPGLLVGDLSQPRGGPMLTGHASHQIGLDADIWLTPMPNRRLTSKEREDISATTMLDATSLAVDPKVWTPAHVGLIKRAASYPQVERVLVHPAIKHALCEAAGADRKWLAKVRPYWGHHYHFHVRIGCPQGSTNCARQNPPPGDDGCGKEVADWLKRLAVPAKPPTAPVKPAKPKPPITMADLPSECGVVLNKGVPAAPSLIAAGASGAPPAAGKSNGAKPPPAKKEAAQR